VGLEPVKLNLSVHLKQDIGNFEKNTFFRDGFFYAEKRKSQAKKSENMD